MFSKTISSNQSIIFNGTIPLYGCALVKNKQKENEREAEKMQWFIHI